MDVGSLYQSKLTTPDQAMAAVPSGSKLSMGMAMAEPPALLKALADRAEAGRIEDLKVYYFESTRIAGETILRYELIDRVRAGNWNPDRDARPAHARCGNRDGAARLRHRDAVEQPASAHGDHA